MAYTASMDALYTIEFTHRMNGWGGWMGVWKGNISTNAKCGITAYVTWPIVTLHERCKLSWSTLNTRWKTKRKMWRKRASMWWNEANILSDTICMYTYTCTFIVYIVTWIIFAAEHIMAEPIYIILLRRFFFFTHTRTLSTINRYTAIHAHEPCILIWNDTMA